MNETYRDDIAKHLKLLTELELHKATQRGATFADLREIVREIEKLTAYLLNVQATREGLTLCDYCNNTASATIKHAAGDTSNACNFHTIAHTYPEHGDTAHPITASNPARV